MKHIHTIVLLLLVASVAFSQSTTLKLPTATSASDFTVKDSRDTVVLRVRGDGRVGVGTSNPNEALEIASSTARAIVSDGQGANRRAFLIVAPTAASDYSRIATIGYGSAGGGKPLIINRAIDGKGKVGIGIDNIPTEQLEVGGTIYSTTGGFKFPDGTVQTTAAASTPSQWITSGSTIYYNAGKVGIGLTNPSTTLQIKGVLTVDSIKFADGTVQTTAAYMASAPVVTSFSPTSGSVGTYVYISGRNFRGARAVKFDTEITPIIASSDTLILVKVPPFGDYTFASISVTTPSGSGTSLTLFFVNGGFTGGGGGGGVYFSSNPGVEDSSQKEISTWKNENENLKNTLSAQQKEIEELKKSIRDLTAVVNSLLERKKEAFSR